jgi:uncharacterized protein (DUF1778 family)
MPVIDETVKRSVPLSVRLRAWERDVIDMAAARAGTTRSEFITRAALREADLCLAGDDAGGDGDAR